jgi:lactate dehydrogenase-like 2-hydroxyacid dehydrogenase
MHGARAWTNETNSVRGEKKISAGGRRLRFSRKRRGAGGGGLDAAWSWSGRERGPWHGMEQRGRRVAGCGVGQCGEAVGAERTGGVGSTVRPIRFSN